MIAAGHLYRDRPLGVELARDFRGRGPEELELQPAAEPRLVDVDEQRIHLRAVRQLAQERAELRIDLAQLLPVQIQIDRLLLLVEVLVLEPRFLAAQLLEVLDLAAGVDEIPGHGDRDEDAEQHQQLGRRVPGAGILPVGALELIEQGVEVDGRHG